MTKTNRVWTIEAIRKLELIARYEVPLHRLENKDAAQLLRILVAKYEELQFEETVNAFLNNRKGGPNRSFIGDAKYFIQPEKRLAGYHLFGPAIYAQATHEISQEVSEFVLKNRNPVAA